MSNGPTMEPLNQRSAQEAVDECMRELNIRKRCFPRWIDDGRVSRTDAQDRIDRMATAVDLLQDAVTSQEVAITKKQLDTAVV